MFTSHNLCPMQLSYKTWHRHSSDYTKYTSECGDLLCNKSHMRRRSKTLITWCATLLKLLGKINSYTTNRQAIDQLLKSAHSDYGT